MASLDSTMHLALTVDTQELEQAIYRLKAGLDVRTKCAIEDCTKQGLERNQIETACYVRGTQIPLRIHVCDEHYDDLKCTESEVVNVTPLQY